MAVVLNEAGYPCPPLTAARLRAAFIANGNPRDLKLWSGTPNHMLAAIEKRFDVALVVEDLWAGWYRPVGRALKLLSGRRFEYVWSERYSGMAAARTIRTLMASEPDVVFSVALNDMTYLFADKLPVVTITDATVPDLIDYYDMYRRISATAKRKAAAAERRAFNNSLMLHFPSRWACRSAIEHHGIDEDRVQEIAWGANMPFLKRSPRSLPQGLKKLLFVGSDWERKGGPIALATAAELQRRGIDVCLDVVGCTDEVLEGRPCPANVRFHGFVDKATADGKSQIEAFYADAALFFLPTRAEAYGIVFAEAAHHGIPSIAYATGGVPSVVRAGETGILLPGEATAQQFADEIQGLAHASDRYEAMSQTALLDARDRLNWDVWAAKLEAAVRERLA